MSNRATERRATIASIPEIRLHLVGDESGEESADKETVNSTSALPAPGEEDADAGEEMVFWRHTVSKVKHGRRRMKSITLSDDSGISGGASGGASGGGCDGGGDGGGGGGGSEQAEGTFMTFGDEPVKSKPAEIITSPITMKDRDTWSSVKKSIADSRASRLSKNGQLLLVNTLASGYTKCKSASAIGGRKPTSNVPAGLESPHLSPLANPARSLRKRESLNEMAGLGSPRGGQSTLPKSHSFKK